MSNSDSSHFLLEELLHRYETQYTDQKGGLMVSDISLEEELDDLNSSNDVWEDEQTLAGQEDTSISSPSVRNPRNYDCKSRTVSVEESVYEDFEEDSISEEPSLSIDEKVSYYKEIKSKFGNSRADEFKQLVKLFYSAGIGKEIDFIPLLAKFFMGEATDEDKIYLGPILFPLQSYADQKRNIKESLEAKLKDSELSDLKSEHQQEIYKKTGAWIEKYWDLQELQHSVYAPLRAIRHYQALVEPRWKPEVFQQFIGYLESQGYLEEKLLLTGLGSLVAKKEVFLVKELMKRGHDVELLLVEKSLRGNEMALLHCIEEEIYSTSRPPHFENWDIEKLNSENFAKYHDILSDRQMLMCIFGNTTKNIVGEWAMYNNIRNILLPRAHGSSFDKGLYSLNC